MKLTLPTEDFIVENQDGSVRLKASSLDLYYTIAMINDDLPEELSIKDKFTRVAEAINAQYSCNFTWGELIKVFNYLQEEIDEVKKNTTSTQE